jgi:hypothetical protein
MVIFGVEYNHFLLCDGCVGVFVAREAMSARRPRHGEAAANTTH